MIKIYQQKTLASGQVVTLIPADELPRYIDHLVHLSWARNKGFVWRLKAINPDGSIDLETPKTKKPMTAWAHEACFVNDFDPNNINGKPLNPRAICGCGQFFNVYYQGQTQCKPCKRKRS